MPEVKLIGRLYRITFLNLCHKPRLSFEAMSHYLAPSKRLAMFGYVNKALLNGSRLSIKRICHVAVLDPDEKAFLVYMAFLY